MGRVIEDVTGEGEVLEGEKVLGRAAYRVTVYQRTLAVRTMAGSGEVDGLKEISGNVRVLAPLSAFELLGKNGLTLRLADGRCWDFVLRDNHGAALNRSGGGLYGR